MRFRKLRIAWSVFWGLACGVLTLVWLWSYWYSLAIYQYSPGEVSGISLYFGEVTAFKWHGTFVGAPDWRVEPTYERTPKKGLASFLVPRFQVRPNLGIPLWFFMLLF